MCFFCMLYADHRDLHVLTHSLPTRRSSDLGVTSRGTFATADANLAAAFGPVTGLTTTLTFEDLIDLRSAPSQVATVAEINPGVRSEEHTSELQSLMRISYAVFCLKKKIRHTNNTPYSEQRQ